MSLKKITHLYTHYKDSHSTIQISYTFDLIPESMKNFLQKAEQLQPIIKSKFEAKCH